MDSAFICRTWGLKSHNINRTNRALPTEAFFSCYSVQQLKTDSVDKICSTMDEKLSWIKWLVCSVIQKHSLCYGGWRLPQLFHASKNINIHIIGEVETPGNFCMWEYTILSNTLSLTLNTTSYWPLPLSSTLPLMDGPGTGGLGQRKDSTLSPPPLQGMLLLSTAVSVSLQGMWFHIIKSKGRPACTHAYWLNQYSNTVQQQSLKICSNVLYSRNICGRKICKSLIKQPRSTFGK